MTMLWETQHFLNRCGRCPQFYVYYSISLRLNSMLSIWYSCEGCVQGIMVENVTREVIQTPRFQQFLVLQSAAG